jgi:hypothetical protein
MENQKTTDPKEFEQKTEPYPLSIGMDPTALTWNPRPDLNGKRITDPGPSSHGDGAVYLIDEGMKRWIPNPGTYENLFRDWSGIIEDHNLAVGIPEGSAFPDGACLVVPAYYRSVWLIDGNRKRLVTAPAVMEKYHFAWNRIYTIPPVLSLYLTIGPDLV